MRSRTSDTHLVGLLLTFVLVPSPQPFLPLPYCSYLEDTSCCRTSGSTHVIAEFLDAVSATLSAGDGKAYARCMGSFETFSCGRYCFPQQAIYLDTTDPSYAICLDFCDQLYASCQDAVVTAANRTVSSLYATSRAFCQAQRIGNYSVIVNQRDLCFDGLNVDASASLSRVSGVGYWLGQAGRTPDGQQLQGRSGVPFIEYCFDVQLEDYYQNPKKVGGDQVVIVDGSTSLAVTDNGNGTYSACYTPTASATYNFSYSINENSPLSFQVTITNASWCPLTTDSPPKPSPGSSQYCPGYTEGACCGTSTRSFMTPFSCHRDHQKC